jgi:hypothetical protein
MKQRLIVFAGAAAFVGLSVVGGELGELALPQAGWLTAYSMLTQDGRQWKGFFCVEPYDAKPHRLAPGESYTRTSEIRFEK